MTMHMKYHIKDAFKSGNLNICGTNVNIHGYLFNAHKIKIDHQT